MRGYNSIALSLVLAVTAVKFLPIVKSVIDCSGLAATYNGTISQIGKTGLVPQQQATVESYVTERALASLYLMTGEEEKISAAIRWLMAARLSARYLAV